MFVEVINSDIADSFSKLHEEDRFYKWYYGYSKIESAYFKYRLPLYTVELKSGIHTTATSGGAAATGASNTTDCDPDLIGRAFRGRT